MNKDGTCYEGEWLGPDGKIIDFALFLRYMEDMLGFVRMESDKETDKLPQ